MYPKGRNEQAYQMPKVSHKLKNMRTENWPLNVATEAIGDLVESSFGGIIAMKSLSDVLKRD